MGKILISGLVNIETSVNVDSFPINYCPIEYPFFGINSCVSGVGYNIAKAIKTLGGDVDLLTEVGDDLNGNHIKDEITKLGIDTSKCLVYKGCKSAESVVLVDKDGKRKIYCDLKDIQDRKPINTSTINMNDYSVLVLTNINFNRRIIYDARMMGKVIATDVHVLSSLDDDYNREFLELSNILFLSNEAIIDKEAEFMKSIYERYHNDYIICGCGHQGALMYIGALDKYIYEPAVAPKGVVSSVGAGDALFSSFIYFYNKGESLENCLKYAVMFAGLKISASGGSNGFICEEELRQYMK